MHVSVEQGTRGIRSMMHVLDSMAAGSVVGHAACRPYSINTYKLMLLSGTCTATVTKLEAHVVHTAPPSVTKAPAQQQLMQDLESARSRRRGWN